MHRPLLRLRNQEASSRIASHSPTMATLSSHAIKGLAAQIMSPSDETRRIRFIYDAKSLRGDAPHLVLCGTCS
jgi:hypothetical protein